MRNVCTYEHWCPGALLYARLNQEKLVAFHEIKWDRDDKSAKASTRRNYPGAVVVKDHNMYPSPRIIFDPKMGHWNMKKIN